MAGRAGDLAKAAFGMALLPTSKTSPLDLVTVIDRSAEDLIVSHLLKRFPHHEILAEETGKHGNPSQWQWLIDPLDGTHNFAIGLPLYGLTLTLLHQQVPVLAVVRDSHLARQLVVTDDGMRGSGGLQIAPPNTTALTTVALQQGYEVRRSDPALGRIREKMEARTQRVLYSWSPSIDVLLLAAGRIGGIVGYRCSGAEHVAARFVAATLGCHVWTERGADITGTYALGWPSVFPQLVEWVATAIATDDD